MSTLVGRGTGSLIRRSRFSVDVIVATAIGMQKSPAVTYELIIAAMFSEEVLMQNPDQYVFIQARLVRRRHIVIPDRYNDHVFRRHDENELSGEARRHKERIP